jgi:hypothetical protein
MIGLKVEFPIGLAAWDIGVVTEYDESTGLITVVNEDGERFRGSESQVSNLEP